MQCWYAGCHPQRVLELEAVTTAGPVRHNLCDPCTSPGQLPYRYRVLPMREGVIHWAESIVLPMREGVIHWAESIALPMREGVMGLSP